MRVLREKGSGRLRASLRAVLPAVATLLLFLAGQVALSAVFSSNGTSLSGGERLVARLLLVGLYVAILVVAVRLATTLDRRPATAYGLGVDTTWVRDFAAGALFSAFGIALSLWWGVVRGHRAVDLSAVVDVTADPAALAVAVAVFVPYFLLGNLYEEFVYRGVMLQNFAVGLVARGRSPRVAVVLATAASVLLFGAYHVPLRGNVVVAVDAAMVGFTFALAYVLTGELGLPLGVHFGRIAIEFLDGFEFLGVRVPGVLAISNDALLANLELKLLELGAISLFVVAWVSVTDGTLGVADAVYASTTDGSDAEGS